MVNRPRRGRPRLEADDPSVRLSFRLPTKQYDALCTRAHDARVNLSEFVRTRLEAPARLRPAKIGDPTGRR